jgi:eukaryotic-like serine/threonine-protein kinase
MIGVQLGPYQIVGKLGEGGMGEVYRARDSRLQREVAIKILPHVFASDPERIARFEREAQTLASLNHPHIAQIFGVEEGPAEAGHVRALVMELVEGETLAARLAGGALPVGEAIRLAGEIADALQAAHDRGIVHRDLKPANIALTADGQVKVLDFGLAKATAPAHAGHSDAANSPTLTLGATQVGVILGTAAYMAPEQAKGKAADKRSDLWAFGCVLYEMLTGRQAFAGEDVTDTLTAVLTREPDWSALPGVSPHVVALLRGCLQRERHLRIADIAVARYVLAGEPGASSQDRAADRPAVGPWRLAAIVSALAAATLGGVSAYLATRATGDARPAWSSEPIRLTIAPPPETTFYNGDYGIPFAVSPDGRQIAFVASRANGVRDLWIRSLDAIAARAIPGTESASSPFWSPDSSWIGFRAEGQLKKVPTSGGTPHVLAPWSNTASAGASWSSQHVLLLPASALSGLSSVSAQGGSASVVTRPDRPEAYHSWPQFLRDGRRFVYTISGREHHIAASSLDGMEAHVLTTAWRMSSLGYAPGFLLYVQRGALYATRFDEDRLQLSGQPVRIVEGIPVSGPGRAPFSVSANGVLAYSSHAVGDMAVLQWVDRTGQPGAVVAPPANYTGFTLSPDGRRLAFARWAPSGGRDVWLRELATGGESRLTSDGDSMMPIWSPRAERVVFASAGETPPDLHLLDLETGAGAEKLHASAEIDEPESWTADGASIVYSRWSGLGWDLWHLTLDGRRTEALPLNTSFNEWQGRVSPDGRWIAYVSDETGTNAVFVAAFPSGRSKRAVSGGAGTSPQWRADGQELFYVSDSYGMMAVPITTAGTRLDAGRPIELFRISQPADLEGRNDAILYRADPRGQRFLIATKAPAADRPPIHVILNWTALVPE